MKRNTVLHSALFLLLAACGGATVSVGSNESKGGVEGDAVPAPPGPTSTSTSQAVTPPPEIDPGPPRPQPPSCGVKGLSTLTTTNAPSPRSNAIGEFAAGRFVVWGGKGATGAVLNDGAMFDPCTGAWTALATANAPTAPRYSARHFVVGNKIIYWGGADAPFSPVPVSVSSMLDVAKNEWTPINRTNEPSFFASGVMSMIGGKIFAWGGDGDSGLFDPTTNTWTKLSTVNAPALRVGPGSAFTSSKFILWGGTIRSFANGAYVHTPQLDGRIWDAATDTWTSLPTLNAPTSASGSMVANEQKAVFVEQRTSFGQHAKTWVYDFAAQSWIAAGSVPMSGVVGNAPTSLTWTGTKVALTYTEAAGSGSYLFDLATLTWTAGKQSPVKYSQLWSDTVGQQVIVRSQPAMYPAAQFATDYFLYDGNVDQWTTVPGISKRMDAAWAWSGDRLFIFGGGPPSDSSAQVAAQNDGYVFIP